MRREFTNKILSIVLVIIVSGFIPSSIAFAASIIVDGDYNINTSETVVDLGVLNYNQPINHVVRVYASGGSVNGAVINSSGTGGISATSGILTGSGWANGIDSSITGNATVSGEYFITWSSTENSLKNNPAIIKVKYTVRPKLEVTWPTASQLTYDQTLSDSNLVNGTSNMVGTFVFDTPEYRPEGGTDFHKIHQRCQAPKRK